jgi:hypothetical protein
MVSTANNSVDQELSVYPNPFRNQLTISFGLKQNAQVRISLLNLLGQEVKILKDGAMQTGNHSFAISAAGLKPGVYMLKLEGAGHTQVRKVVLSE